MNGELLLLGLFALFALFWWDSLKKRELVIGAARRACAQAGVQLLDDSVALTRLRLARDGRQRLCFAREYAFEFTDTGNNRLSGHIHLLGARLIDVALILPPDPTPPAPAQTAQILPFVRRPPN